MIVGLGVVAGIEAFEENGRKASMDNMTTMATGYAGKMIEWKLKPSAQGGGQSANAFIGFDVNNLGLEGGKTLDFLGGSTSNWAEVSGLYVSVWEHAAVLGATHVAVHDPKYDTQISIFVYGPDPQCFVHRTSYMQDGSRVDIPSMWPENPDTDLCTF
ncbi:MAG: hypothetical protein AAGG50_09510 [Bacteroidota bacterium]